MKATPEDHLDRIISIHNLGNHLSTPYSRTGNLQDLEDAITHTEAGRRTQGKSTRLPRACTVGHLLGMRFKRTGNLQDLEAAITHIKAAVEVTPEDHPDRAEWLSNLGHRLASRYKQTGNLQDLHAIDARVGSWNIPTALMLTHIPAARKAAEMLLNSPSATSEDLLRTCSLLHDATHLIPLATSRSLEREDQQHIMEEIRATSVVSLALAASLQAGKSPLEVLRLQELGRSVTNGQLL